MEGTRQSETPPLSNESSPPLSNATQQDQLSKFSSHDEFVRLKKFVQNERIHTSLSPAELQRVCYELSTNHSADFHMTLDKFRMSLNEKNLSVESPLPFSAFWIDFVKCVVFSTTIMDNVTLGTLHKLVQECIPLPSCVELYSDFPPPAPSSAFGHYTKLQLQSNPELTESELKSNYCELTTAERINLINDWEAEMHRYNGALEHFLQIHSDELLRNHMNYVNTMKVKIDKGIEQIRKMLNSLEQKAVTNSDFNSDPLFMSFHRAAESQPQFASLPAIERNEKIGELYRKTDPTLRQIVQKMMADSSSSAEEMKEESSP